MSKRNSKPGPFLEGANKPVTKGLALILAREILGPAASVLVKGPERVIVAPGCAIFANNWETALEEARNHPNAEAWENYKFLRKSAFKDAVASLKATAISLLRGKDAKLLTKSDSHFVRNSLRGLA